MNVYNEIMKDPFLSKQVLIKFGFGEVVPVKVERFVKKEYPNLYYQCRRAANSEKVVPMQVEAMSVGRRNAILDKEEVYSKIVREKLDK